MQLQCNVGEKDRILRIVVGLAIIVIGLLAHNWLGVIGLVPLVTGFVRFCPAYKLMGFSTEK